jgi:hypothetical protein
VKLTGRHPPIPRSKFDASSMLASASSPASRCPAHRAIE